MKNKDIASLAAAAMLASINTCEKKKTSSKVGTTKEINANPIPSLECSTEVAVNEIAAKIEEYSERSLNILFQSLGFPLLKFSPTPSAKIATKLIESTVKFTQENEAVKDFQNVNLITIVPKITNKTL
jgi:hypothetical protein